MAWSALARHPERGVVAAERAELGLEAVGLAAAEGHLGACVYGAGQSADSGDACRRHVLSLRSTSVGLAPAAWKARTQPSPMPIDPPVTMTTLSS